jgi:hypothetical protein
MPPRLLRTRREMDRMYVAHVRMCKPLPPHQADGCYPTPPMHMVRPVHSHPPSLRNSRTHSMQHKTQANSTAITASRGGSATACIQCACSNVSGMCLCACVCVCVCVGVGVCVCVCVGVCVCVCVFVCAYVPQALSVNTGTLSCGRTAHTFDVPFPPCSPCEDGVRTHLSFSRNSEINQRVRSEHPKVRVTEAMVTAVTRALNPYGGVRDATARKRIEALSCESTIPSLTPSPIRSFIHSLTHGPHMRIESMQHEPPVTCSPARSVRCHRACELWAVSLSIG